MYIVTGISRGLGEGIVKLLLEKEHEVVGIGRSNPFGSKIRFITCDLSDPGAVAKTDFGTLKGDVTLINNAGILGTIGRISEQEESDLEKVMQVNVFAPMTITRKLYAQLSPEQKFRLVNISSGAANRSIPAWSAYCASKAALNRLTENFFVEELERQRNVEVYAVAPGVIDTDMQVEIRSTDKDVFSGKDNFVRMKEEGELFSPNEAAQQLLKLLESPFNNEVFHDLRDV